MAKKITRILYYSLYWNTADVVVARYRGGVYVSDLLDKHDYGLEIHEIANFFIPTNPNG